VVRLWFTVVGCVLQAVKNLFTKDKVKKVVIKVNNFDMLIYVFKSYPKYEPNTYMDNSFSCSVFYFHVRSLHLQNILSELNEIVLDE